MFNTGSFAVYDVDQSNELRPTSITVALANSRVGRVADVEWLPLPDPVGKKALRCHMHAQHSNVEKRHRPNTRAICRQGKLGMSN